MVPNKCVVVNRCRAKDLPHARVDPLVLPPVLPRQLVFALLAFLFVGPHGMLIERLQTAVEGRQPFVVTVLYVFWCVSMGVWLQVPTESFRKEHGIRVCFDCPVVFEKCATVN